MTFYFAPVFKYIFLYVLICLLLIAGFWTKMVGGWPRRRRGRRSRMADKVEQDEAQQAAQQDNLVQQQTAQQDGDDQQQDDDEAQQTASGFGASGSRSIYLRGPASLPQRPILRNWRPLIWPDGERHVTLCSSFLFILCVQNHN
jgi:FtsZ-interacting cell division protein ZipA